MSGPHFVVPTRFPSPKTNTFSASDFLQIFTECIKTYTCYIHKVLKQSYAYLQSVVCRRKKHVTKTLNNLTCGFPTAKFRKRGHRNVSTTSLNRSWYWESPKCNLNHPKQATRRWLPRSGATQFMRPKLLQQRAAIAAYLHDVSSLLM